MLAQQVVDIMADLFTQHLVAPWQVDQKMMESLIVGVSARLLDFLQVATIMTVKEPCKVLR